MFFKGETKLGFGPRPYIENDGLQNSEIKPLARSGLTEKRHQNKSVGHGVKRKKEKANFIKPYWSETVCV